MTIGQLWFGWASRGAEGLNRQQIIAASGVLDDPDQPLTQKVLHVCYGPRRPTFGWVDRPGLRVAFRRSPTGLDSRGRPGNFFVHALAAAPQALPPAALGPLFSSPLWHEAAPPDPPRKLPALDGLATLRLGPPVTIAPAELRTLLAGHLANVARGKRSAVALPDDAAAAAAARIAAALPPAFGLQGFSTDEAADRAEGYDLVAGKPPSARFAAIAPDAAVDAAWQDVAELLLAAAEGDCAAADAVAALAERAATADAFASSLREWTLLDRGVAPGDAAGAPPHAGTLRTAASDPRLARRLLDGPGRTRLFQAVAAGQPDALAIVRQAGEHGREDALAAPLATALEPLPPPAAAATLSELAQVNRSLASAVADPLLRRWEQEQATARLSPADAIVLARILPAPVGAPGHGAATLLEEPALVEAIAVSPAVAVEWRALATARTPDVLQPSELARALIEQPGFARALLTRPSPAVLNAIGAAIDAVAPTQGRAIVETAAPYVAEVEADAWRWSVLSRLPDAAARYRQMQLLLVRRLAAGDVWALRALDAFVEAVMTVRDAGTPLPHLPDAVLSGAQSMRATTWRALRAVLGARTSASDIASEASGLVEALDSGDRDAALEVAVDALLAAYRDPSDLSGALQALAARGRDARPDLARRVARAAQRQRKSGSRGRVLVATRWIAMGVALERIPEELLDEPVVASIGRPWPEPERAALRALAESLQTSKRTQRWLERLARERESPRLRLRR